jgi:hypothetical protein
VKRIRGELVRLGWLVELERRRGKTTHYGLTIPEAVSEKDPRGVSGRHGPGSLGDGGVSDVDAVVSLEDPKLKEVSTEAGSEMPVNGEPVLARVGGASYRWAAVRRDECVLCDQLRQVSGDGVCQACSEGRVAA